MLPSITEHRQNSHQDAGQRTRELLPLMIISPDVVRTIGAPRVVSNYNHVTRALDNGGDNRDTDSQLRRSVSIKADF